MKSTFLFVFQSLSLLFTDDFYLLPLVLFSFLFLLNIIKEVRSL